MSEMLAVMVRIGFVSPGTSRPSEIDGEQHGDEVAAGHGVGEGGRRRRSHGKGSGKCSRVGTPVAQRGARSPRPDGHLRGFALWCAASSIGACRRTSPHPRAPRSSCAFLRLGVTSFGGPVAHLEYLRREFVERRQWMDAAHYGQLLAVCQLLPGPASSQLGFGIGLLRGGWRGALAAFAGFTLPSVLLLLLFVQTRRVGAGRLVACAGARAHAGGGRGGGARCGAPGAVVRVRLAPRGDFACGRAGGAAVAVVPAGTAAW
jgi:hypothetical protein